jgi:carbon-monoxide dehydrogenase catalytic subunit
VGIPPVLHLGSCVDNSRILLAATEVVKAGGLGKDICDLPAAGSAPEWMSEKAISIGHYFVASGVYTVFGLWACPPPAPRCSKTTSVQRDGKAVRRQVGSEADPIKHAHDDRPHRQKTQELGIDKARERVLMDMADRQALEGLIAFNENHILNEGGFTICLN